MKTFALIFLAFLGICSISEGKQELEVTDQVYFDMDIDGFHEGRVIIGLFGGIVPKTVQNFKVLATTGVDNKTYIGSKFHRIIKNFMIQGGDIISGNGQGSISIYGDKFPDENFIVKHSSDGFVSMANSGPDTNGCQFFITTTNTPWLDGHHTVFGKVISGMKVIRTIENIRNSKLSGNPTQLATIREAGILPTPTPFMITDEKSFFWAWIKASALPLTMTCATLALFQWFIHKLNSVSSY